jgi:N-acyl-D-amino-acid deacylase
MRAGLRWSWALLVALGGGCGLLSGAEFDVVLRHGTIYDGGGGAPYVGDIALKGDRIAAVGDVGAGRGLLEVEVRGLAVAPGFVNMLSNNVALLHDGRSQSNLRQGVTLEVLGEGTSMGPMTAAMKTEAKALQGDIKFPYEWTTLGQYLEHLERRGVSCNFTSFVGATTVRLHELGHENRGPTAAELARMQALVREAMEEGAVGISSALIYEPGFYAKTSELIALARAVAPYGGRYQSHLRSEGNQFVEAVDEVITIAREAGVPAGIYHLKAAGQSNWPKLETVIQRIESARASGLAIVADMYTYTAAASGLDAMMPPWVRAGGYQAWASRLRDPAVRERVKREIVAPSSEWENFYLAAGSPDKILLAVFKNPALKPLAGKTLAEVAKLRGSSPVETAMDLVIEDGSVVGAVYFLMSEESVRRQIALPWMAFDSDESSQAPEGIFLRSNPHPRAYGTFARVLGKYVRDEKALSLAEAVRRLSLFPAQNLNLRERGALRPGWVADVVVFDPATIQDHATYDQPHQYATGMRHVFVNGVAVIRDGEHTGARPGRFVRGPGWRPKP